MSATTLTRRRTKAFAERQKAKERRQKIFVVGALVVLAVVLAFELPTILNRGGSSTPSSASSVATPAPTAPAAPVQNPAALRRALRQPAHDPFAAKTVRPGANTLGTVATPAGLHDPFASRSTPAAAVAVAPVAPKPAVVSQLPAKIIIGTPGAGRVAVTGWILILASIPTAKGERSATAFASSARAKGLNSVSLLNSSNRRPLRGGYWVVYTGPYGSLTAVNNASSAVHGKGFSTAYIRQLVIYKAKTN
jgi:hypothetical protein